MMGQPKTGAFKLVRIERRKIRELQTNWKVSLEEMTKIAKQLMEDKGDDHQFACKLYGTASPPSPKRLENFRRTTKSIRDHGYLTFLDASLEERQKLFPCNAHSALPRVYDGNRINDGRHRLAALLANGIEETLVALCAQIHVDRSKAVEADLALCEEVRRAAFLFIEEEESKRNK